MKDRFLEKDFQSLFTKWIKKNAWASFPYELKISKGKTVLFSKFEKQQIPALRKSSQEVLHYKFSDASFGLKPCDGVVFKNSLAYVGIMFEVNKQQDIAYFIEINDVLNIIEDGKKSIKLDDIKNIAIEINLRK